MNIGVAYDNGQIAQNLGGCRTFLVVTTEGQNPTGKHLAQAEDDNTTALLKLASKEKLDVMICGSLGLAIRNGLHARLRQVCRLRAKRDIEADTGRRSQVNRKIAEKAPRKGRFFS